MGYQIRYTLTVHYVPDGAGAMSVANGASKKFTFTNPGVQVPGGNAPTAANFNTAITGGMTTDLEAQVLANLTELQSFATGGA